jgi:exo-beta-1,3-glucanase (GH17 family)
MSSCSAPLNTTGFPSFDKSKPFAIAYSPYTSSGGCKDVSAISRDLQSISDAGFQCIRLYGTDCNQVSNVLSAITTSGSHLKLFLGVFDLGNTHSQTNDIISALKGDWSKVVTVSVGNEPVNQGQASVSTVISTTSAVRSQLRT